MGLRVLVIGRGTAPVQSLANGHTLFFRQSALTRNGTILSLDNVPVESENGVEQLLGSVAIVFQHLSPDNPEARQAVTVWIKNGWQDRIVGFSGGQVPSEFNDLD